MTACWTLTAWTDDQYPALYISIYKVPQ